MSETARQWDDGADYYSTSADDVERLVHEELDECIWEHLEGCGGTIEEAVAKGITVHAWRRCNINIEDEAKNQLDYIVENLSFAILEEYGDKDGNSEDVFGDDAEEAFKVAVKPALMGLLSTVKPWRCDIISERTFTADELLEWVRENEPEWLEEES